MSVGGSQEVGSIHASVGLDTADLKRGLDQAKQALSESARMTQDALRFTNALAQGMDREAAATRRASLAKQQQAALDRELTGAKAQLGAALSNEDRLVGQVRAKYSLLSEARRAELIEVRQQIAAQDALAAAAVKAANAQAAAQRNLGRSLQSVGRGLTGAVTTPIVGAALAAGYAGQQVQQAEAGIRAGTGLTGGALKSVEESFKKVAPEVSQPLAEVGQAVTELERRTGLTGTALEKLAVSELNLQRITGSGKEIFTESAQAFAAWNVPAEKQIPLLDEVSRAHQLTGINVDKLLNSMAKTAPTFREMGKSYEDQIAIFGAFNKAGIVPERLITALNTAMGKLAKAGVPDVGRAMSDMLQRIQNLKNPTEALSEAVRLFGARGGTQLADALRTGKLSIDQLENSIKHGSDTIAKTAKDTETFSVVWGKMRNAFLVVLAPLGEVILQFTVLAMRALKPAIEGLGRLLEAFGKLDPGLQEFILGTAAVIAALGPLVSGIGGLIATFGTLKAAWTGITLAFGATEGIAALPLLLNPITLALGALAAAVLAVTTNWNGMGDAFRMGLGTLKALPGNLAAGYGAMGALRRSAQEAIGANAPQEDVWADVGMVRVPDAPRVTAPPRPRPGGVPALSAAERAALEGRTKPNLTEAQKEDQRATEQMLKDARELAFLQRGESVDVARLAGEYPHLAAARLEEIVASRKQLDAAVKAAESRKAYGKDIEKLNAEIRRLKTGHDAEAGGLDALKEKYPGLTRVQLAHLFATEQYEKALNKLHETQQRVNERIAAAGVAFMGQTAATNAGRMALQLFKEQADKFAAEHPGGTAGQFWNTLQPNQQRRAKFEAFRAAQGSLTEQSDALDRSNAALYTGQRAQRYAQENYGADLGHLPTGVATNINRYFDKQDINEQRQAGFDAFNAPIGQRNQLIGTIAEQTDQLSRQFAALAGKSTLARETMEKFGVTLKDLPKDTQRSVKGFFELQHSLDFFKNFANGVQNVFQNMFTHLAEHGFKGFFRNVIQGFSQMLQQMAAQYLASQLTGLLVNAIGGAFGAAPAHRAGGGAVESGSAYFVGERGTELFVPRQSGSIVPHAALAGAGGHTTINMTVVAQDVQSFRAPHNQAAIFHDLHREMDRAKKRAR